MEPKALTDPLVVGTIAMFEVIVPSGAFRVETKGLLAPCGHKVRNPIGPGGTTVALSTNDCADAGTAQPLEVTFTSIAPLKGCDPAGFLVSSTRHGVKVKKDNPPVPGGAKYPLMSMTRSESCVAKTEISPFVPAGTIAALAVTAPVGAFRVETNG